LAALITATLGSILGGLATPTEAAGVGASGGLLLALLYGRLTPIAVKNAVVQTLTTSSMVLFLAVASNIFGAVFSRLGAATLITNSLIALQWPPIAMLVVLMVLIFLLGWPFEWPAIILVFVPILWPVFQALQFDPIWIGALIAVNLQTAFLSPPVAMSAYYLKQVVPKWTLSTIYRGMADFMIIQVIAIALVVAFPGIATWLPRYLFFN
jgi:TRAP-type mannitol/chloroaromatic compound transport system permease large subunit